MKRFARWLYMKMWRRELVAIKHLVYKAKDDLELKRAIGVLDALEILGLYT